MKPVRVCVLRDHNQVLLLDSIPSLLAAIKFLDTAEKSDIE